MSDEKDDTTANLGFFRSAILEPVLKHQESLAAAPQRSIASDFDAVEAVIWACVGARSGYFDARAALELVSSSESVFRAWSNLRDAKIISAEHAWANVIRLRENGQPTLNEEWFSATEFPPEEREPFQQCLQTMLLLIAENILDDDSRYFMDGIGWSHDRDWSASRGGTNLLQLESARRIGVGFANVLNFWAEMVSWSQSALDSSFTQGAWRVMRPRFNLGKIEIVDRYFDLAGQFAGRAREDSPAWLDVRLKVFDRLILLMTYASGEVSVREHKTRLWRAFTRGIESFQQRADQSADSAALT